MKFLKEMFKAIILAIIITFIMCNMAFAVFEKNKNVDFNGLEITEENKKSTVKIEKIFEEKPTIEIERPKEGDQYARLVIESANIDLPIYYGYTKEILNIGVGQDNNAYLPGEGGSVILLGHNFKKFLANLPQAQIGDEIKVITFYGEFKYTIYDTQIIKETQIEKVPIQEEEDILMVYTCWPINNISHAYERYVVYAK